MRHHDGRRLDARKKGQIAESDAVRDGRNAGSTAQFVLTTLSRATSGRYIFVWKQED
jgi:hypothetical protein